MGVGRLMTSFINCLTRVLLPFSCPARRTGGPLLRPRGADGTPHRPRYAKDLIHVPWRGSARGELTG